VVIRPFFTFSGKNTRTVAQTTTISMTAAAGLLIISIMLAGSTTIVSVFAATIPGPNGQIAFSSNREDDNYEIYAMHGDGSNVTRLTDEEADDFNPSWSPDGQKIAISSNRVGDENYEIYVMKADDGSDVTRLTHDDVDDRQPNWGTNTHLSVLMMATTAFRNR
jgi:dipeptidyl aminopeptidase/acylaminoacyl peptidase